MVKLNILVEGGSYDNQASVACNVESLRQSLHQFFTRVLDRDDISITVSMGAGYLNAARKFAQSEDGMYMYMFVDSDGWKKEEWFAKRLNQANPEKTIVIPDGRKSDVYFMIQEMEAWFLKQPTCLDRWAESEGYVRKKPHEDISGHSLICGKDIETIRKPSEKLCTLLKVFFEKERGGKMRGAQYGKLKTAPKLLDALNVAQLIPKDAELQRFKASF